MGGKLSWTEPDRDIFVALVDVTSAQALLHPSSLATLLSPLAMMPMASLTTEAAREQAQRLIGDHSALGSTNQERYSRYMEIVQENPYYKWLIRDPRFRKAQEFFDKQQRKRQPNKYHFKWAELRFLTAAAMLGYFVLLKRKNYRPRIPTSRDRQQALARVKLLMQSFARGVSLSSWQDQQTVSRLVDELSVELGKKTGRKRRVDSTYIYRQAVQLLTSLLLNDFGEASPTIIANFAAVIGYVPDDAAMDRHIREARLEWSSRRKEVA